ncbi:MAG: isoaspartyl peptidase/L-asparaginase [Candidatus Promineifilaceae bacterium]|nr:isoaspartyl peptidase/L-asparaginase [Candidatus Promineifilaceae bacterium]
MQPIIIVHGGAGSWQEGEQYLRAAEEACAEAARTAQRILTSQGTALDAVEAAVRLLEDAPECDAGRGSYLNTAGQIELDALIMDGATLEMGAVGAVKHIRNPITLARRVLDSTPHNFLVAEGAEAFAKAIKFPLCTLDDLLVDPRRQHPPDVDHERPLDLRIRTDRVQGDTVGAVALDSQGDVAAATSTGGTKGKWPGRIGDSPLVGSGAYADNLSAAVSATGQGEALMRIVISRRVCQSIEAGASVQEASQGAIALLANRVNGQGGVICVGSQGGIGVAYNTRVMPHAIASGTDSIRSGH